MISLRTPSVRAEATPHFGCPVPACPEPAEQAGTALFAADQGHASARYRRGHLAHFLTVAALLAGMAAGCKSNPTVTSNGLGVPVPAGLEQAGQPPPTSSLVDIARLARGHGPSSQPAATATQPTAAAFLPPGAMHLALTPWKVIFLTFQNSPAIKVAYLQYAGEKARYDYIIATWTSSTRAFPWGRPGTV
jgi:hypothetical protein